MINLLNFLADYPLMDKTHGYNLSQGLQIPLQYVNDITNHWFLDLFFIVLFLGVGLTSHFAQKRRKGDNNILATFAVVGLGVWLFMLMLSTLPGLITGAELIIGLVLELLLLVLFFVFSERQTY